MEFQVSARKWRPQKFSQLIGQEHIIRTLQNAVNLDRISHAYLFSGTRGVGKTTTARILAKALNCESGPTPDPCDACAVCREIREGSSIDVREIDGASNNGVAEVRDLIDNVQYATSSCRYKVYIIDEVHMLSKSAFNALLKTLEEPPERVVFIFATTESEKIPETILSRCQCFEFKPLTHKQIIQQLKLISEQEGIAINALSLEEIAKNGAGSMRDAQSLLDQVIAFSGREVTPGSVEAVLGIVGQKTLQNFVEGMRARDFAALVTQVQETVNAGKDLSYICRDLAEYVRNLLVVKVASTPESLMDAQSQDLEVLKRQAESFHADELHQIFSLLMRTEAEMKRSSLPQQVFEMALFRLADVRPFQKVDEMIQRIAEMEEAAAPAEVPPVRVVQAPPALPVTRQESAPAPARKAVAREDSSEEVPGVVSQEVAGDGPARDEEGEAAGVDPALGDAGLWEKIKAEICAKKSVFLHYLEACEVVEFNASVLHLGFQDPYTRGLVENEGNLALIAQAVKSASGRDVRVKTSEIKTRKTEAAEEAGGEKKNPSAPASPLMSKSESEIIQQALDVFGGVLVR